MTLTERPGLVARFMGFLESIWRDVRHGARSLRRQPGMMLVAVLTLGLGVGFSTSIFTVFNSLALRPWPVSNPDSVVCLLSAEKGETPASGFALSAYRYFRDNSASFSGMIATRPVDLRLGESSTAGEFHGLLVSPNFFRVLDVRMQLGRSFADENGNQPVIVLSHRFWKSHLAGDYLVIGRQLSLDGVSFTVAGVTSPEFIGTSVDGQDFWIPEESERFLLPPGSPLLEFTRSTGYESWAVAGRLSDGVDASRARAEIELLNRQFRDANGLPPGEIAAVGTSPFSSPGGRAEFLPVFALMFAGVLLVLLLASANVGNLLLARAAGRQRETAARLALGASRRRLVRQLLTESMLLALSAAGLGVLLAAWLPRLVLGAYVGESVYWVKPDLTVLLFTLAASVAACLVFGLAPALHATRMSLADAIKAQHSRIVGRYSLRSVLLAAQVAISVVLLVSAGLLVQGVQAVAAREPGFRLAGVASAQVKLPANLYDGERTQAFVEQLQGEAAASGLWDSVAVTAHVPLGPGLHGSFMTGTSGSGSLKTAFSEEVSPEYFEILGIPVLSGRAFGPADRRQNVILVNETMARRLSPGQSPLGSVLTLGREAYQVIGVVKDARTADLYRVEPTLYRPFQVQSVGYNPLLPAPSLLLLSSGRVNAERALQAIATRLEPGATVRIEPLEKNVDKHLRPSRVGAALAGTLGLVALILAAVGLFGVFAFSVRRQSREIATRMALGARPAQVVSRTLLSSSRPAAVGLLIGFVAAAAASRFLEIHLYGISRMEPYTYLVVGLLVAVSALGASLWPAWMIARVEPSIALRSE